MAETLLENTSQDVLDLHELGLGILKPGQRVIVTLSAAQIRALHPPKDAQHNNDSPTYHLTERPANSAGTGWNYGHPLVQLFDAGQGRR